jgi:hypothetical protein
VLALAGLAVVIAGGTVVLWPRPERITRENCRRINTGLSRTEVEAILGPPLSSSPLNPLEVRARFPDDADVDEKNLPCRKSTWMGDALDVEVEFNSSDYAVAYTIGTFSTEFARSRFEAFLMRAERKWHRWFPE